MKSTQEERICIVCALNSNKAQSGEILRLKAQEMIGLCKTEDDAESLIFQVSEDKSFTQFWNDYGLIDYRDGYKTDNMYSIDDKYFVIQCWMKHLYEEKHDLPKLKYELIPKTIELYEDAKIKDVNIKLSVIDFVPMAIDELLESYMFTNTAIWL